MLNNRGHKGSNKISLNLTIKGEMIIFGQIIIKINPNSFQDRLNRIETIITTKIIRTTKTISIRIIMIENPKIIQISIVIIFREGLMKDKILIDKIIDMIRMIGIDSHKIIINREIINMKVN